MAPPRGSNKGGRRVPDPGAALPSREEALYSRLPAGRHGLTRSEVTGSQRKRLMDAMAAVCSEKGYPAVTVADVVEGARVSRATFYELFKDKEDCFIATMEEGVRMLGSAVLPVVYAPSDSWPLKVRETIAALLNFLAENPAYAETAMIEALAGGDVAFERYSVGTSLIVTLLDEGRSYVKTEVNAPSGTARAILGGGEWLIRGEMMAGRTNRIPDLLPDFLYMALTPYVGQEEALRQARDARDARLA